MGLAHRTPTLTRATPLHSLLVLLSFSLRSLYILSPCLLSQVMATLCGRVPSGELMERLDVTLIPVCMEAYMNDSVDVRRQSIQCFVELEQVRWRGGLLMVLYTETYTETWLPSHTTHPPTHPVRPSLYHCPTSLSDLCFFPHALSPFSHCM